MDRREFIVTATAATGAALTGTAVTPADAGPVTHVLDIETVVDVTFPNTPRVPKYIAARWSRDPETGKCGIEVIQYDEDREIMEPVFNEDGTLMMPPDEAEYGQIIVGGHVA